ncbi:nuclear transport factor 2 family protein [Oscillatoria sp. FACHB-1407]|nr:nuclear transport factor 2 family protein [Oscillatoria sp. FACHB-1407]
MTAEVQSVDIASPIDVISEPVILTYFETLNAGDFQATADLFAESGVLRPPFDEELVGREAIAQYLAAEAKGMKFQPLMATYGVLETGDTEFTITGKVQTALFGVNVAWNFVLNPDSQILSVQIKLLAGLEELLNLKPGQDKKKE